LSDCTLREAIAAAQAHAGTDLIAFDIPDTDSNFGHNTPGVWTIILSSPLIGPNSPDGEIVDGDSQAESQGDFNPYGPEIEISGEALDPGSSCWLPYSGNTLKGLVINRCPAYGIRIYGDNNTIIGNYIGTDAAAILDEGVGADGIFLGTGVENNTIGGPTEPERNIISGNTNAGIRINGATATGNLIQGNYIGTDRTATAPLGNYRGIQIESEAHHNTIGPDNIIAYNDFEGVCPDCREGE
jgi:hypothetical protein